jgi:hypothetical protein
MGQAYKQELSTSLGQHVDDFGKMVDKVGQKVDEIIITHKKLSEKLFPMLHFGEHPGIYSKIISPFLLPETEI